VVGGLGDGCRAAIDGCDSGDGNLAKLLARSRTAAGAGGVCEWTNFGPIVCALAKANGSIWILVAALAARCVEPGESILDANPKRRGPCARAGSASGKPASQREFEIRPGLAGRNAAGALAGRRSETARTLADHRSGQRGSQ